MNKLNVTNKRFCSHPQRAGACPIAPGDVTASVKPSDPSSEPSTQAHETHPPVYSEWPPTTRIPPGTRIPVRGPEKNTAVCAVRYTRLISPIRLRSVLQETDTC